MLSIKCLIKKNTTCNKLEIVVRDESNKKGQKSLTAVPNNSNDQPEGKLLHKKPQRRSKDYIVPSLLSLISPTLRYRQFCRYKYQIKQKCIFSNAIFLPVKSSLA